MDNIKTIRLGSVNSEKQKTLAYVLARINGLGINSSYYLCHILKINPLLKLTELTEEQINTLNQILDAKTVLTNTIYKNNEDKINLLLDTNIKIYVKKRIALLKKLKTYVGIRHSKNYKVHGQKTKSTGRRNKKNKSIKRNVKA